MDTSALDAYDPLLPTEPPRPASLMDKENAFYTAGVHSVNGDMEGTYASIVDEIGRTGSSTLAEEVRNAWAKEQERIRNDKVSSILIDPSLDKEAKKVALRKVLEEEQAAQNPRNRYSMVMHGYNTTATPYGEEVQKQTPSIAPPAQKPPAAGSIAEKKAIEGQRTFMDHLRNFGVQVRTMKDVMGEQGFWESVKDTGEAALTIGSSIFTTMASGYVGLYKIAVEDAPAAEEAMKKIAKAAYTGDGKVYEQGMQTMAALGQTLEVPFRLAGDTVFEKTLDLTGNIDVAATAGSLVYAVPQTFGYATGGYGAVKAAVGGAKAFEVVKAGLKAGSPLPTGTVKDPRKSDKPTIGEIDPDSPLGVTATVNRPAAAEIAANAAKHDGLAGAAGVARGEVVFTTLLPKLDPEIDVIHPDIGEKLTAYDQEVGKFFNAESIDPYLFDPAAIHRDINHHYEVTKQQSELTPLISSSYFEDAGTLFKGKLLFGKTENLGFLDPTEAELALKKFNAKLKEEFGKKGWDNRASLVHHEDTGEWFLSWNFRRDYHPEHNTFFGLGSTNAVFAGLDVTPLANTAFGKLFYNPATRLPEWTTAGAARTAIRTTNMEEVIGTILREEILTTKPNRELANAIYQTEEKGKYLNVSALREMYPLLNDSDFKSLVNGYTHYRRVVEYLYQISNRTYRDNKLRMEMAGMYDEKGRYVGLAREVLPDPEGKVVYRGSDDNPPTTYYDFTLVEKTDSMTGAVKKERNGPQMIDPDNPPRLLRLDEPIRINGQSYEFVTGVRLGKVPEKLLPEIPGYYPHINKEAYYVTATPKVLYINGNPVLRNHGTPEQRKKAEDLYREHSSTVGVANTLAAAEKYAQDYSKKDKQGEFEYTARAERTDINDGLNTHMQMVKFNQDVARSRREERLKLPDGTLGRLEDPVLALDKRMKQAVRLNVWSQWDNEFRNSWLQSYSHLAVDGKFPEQVSDIRAPKDASPLDMKKVVEAKNLFEQYTKQQRAKETFLDPTWQSVTLAAARAMEPLSPAIAEKVRALSKTREPIFSNMLKLATFKYIHLNPIRQWLVQPAQVYELQLMALMNKNPGYLQELWNLGPRLLADLISRGSQIPGWVKKIHDDSGHIGTGLSKEEFRELADAFWNSGLPKSIDLHATIDGVFRSAAGEIDIGKAEKAAQSIRGVGRGVRDLPKVLGYNGAELFNTLGQWLYARSEFIRNNPDKKWNDPHNLELIAQKQWGIGNSMSTRGDLLPYQEGAARAFLQFAAYSNKAVMQPFNSKFLTKREKTQLAAIRFIVYGEKGVLGVKFMADRVREYLYANMASDPTSLEQKSLIEEILNLMERGAGDKALNSLIRMVLDSNEEGAAKTDLMFSKSFAPSPESGLPLGDLVKDALEIYKGQGRFGDKFPAFQALSALTDTVNDIHGLLYMRKSEGLTLEDVPSYILKATEFASGWSNFEKGLAMAHYGSIVNRLGEPLDLQATLAEAMAKIGGIQSYKEDAYYTVLTAGPRLQKEIRNTATKIMRMLDTLADVADKEPKFTESERWRQTADRVNQLVEFYASNHLDDELRAEVWRQIKAKEGKEFPSVVSSLFKRRSNEYDASRVEMVKKLQKLQETGGENAARVIENLYLDFANPERNN